MGAIKMGRVLYLNGKNFKRAEIFEGGWGKTIRKFEVNSANTILIFIDILSMAEWNTPNKTTGSLSMWNALL